MIKMLNLSDDEMKTIRLIDLHSNCGGVVVIIFAYVVPVLAVVVSVVNCLIVAVFIKPHIRSHTTFLLTWIACVDMLNIICPTVQYIYHYTLGRYGEYLSYVQCIVTYILADILVDMLNMISLWLTVLLAYIRCKCLKTPFAAHFVHSKRLMLIYVCCILVLALCVHVPSFFMFDFAPIETRNPTTNITAQVCGIRESKSSILKPHSQRKLHVLAKTVIDSLVPCALLVYFNLVMLNALRKAKKFRRSLRYHEETNELHDGKSSLNKPSKGRQNVARQREERQNIQSPLRKCLPGCCFLRGIERQSQSEESALDRINRECRRTSWLILMVSTIVLLHEIPLSVAHAYALATHKDVPLPINIYGCFSAVLLLWQYITYPVIFLIYSCMSSAFRIEICNLMTCMCFVRREQATNRVVFMSPCSVKRNISKDDETTFKAFHEELCEND